jgi:hypothetical protein
LQRELGNKPHEVCIPPGAKVVWAPGPFLVRPGKPANSGSKATLSCHLGEIWVQHNLATTRLEQLEEAELLREVSGVEDDPAVREPSGGM